jgi:TolA-binding protein
MPSNKWAEWQVYLEAFQLGLIDRVEALKKTEIFDKEGILKRSDELAQLQQQLAQQEEKIKDLSGDLQTARRETVAAKQRTEVEKYKTSLSDGKSKFKADGAITTEKLKNLVALEKERLKNANGKPKT